VKELDIPKSCTFLCNFAFATENQTLQAIPSWFYSCTTIRAP